MRPHQGRSYTAASGAFVRVDYVKPDGDVCCVIWPAWWAANGDGQCMRFTGAAFADLSERHDLQPVAVEAQP